MKKISSAQVGQMMKLAAENLRALSEENQQIKTERDEAFQKVAAFERSQRVEKIAHQMQAKGLNPELSLEEKISNLSKNEKLDVIEEAVGMSAPQTKIASVAGDDRVSVEGFTNGADAADAFAANLASIGG